MTVLLLIEERALTCASQVLPKTPFNASRRRQRTCCRFSTLTALTRPFLCPSRLVCVFAVAFLVPPWPMPRASTVECAVFDFVQQVRVLLCTSVSRLRFVYHVWKSFMRGVRGSAQCHMAVGRPFCPQPPPLLHPRPPHGLAEA